MGQILSKAFLTFMLESWELKHCLRLFVLTIGLTGLAWFMQIVNANNLKQCFNSHDSSTEFQNALDKIWTILHFNVAEIKHLLINQAHFGQDVLHLKMRAHARIHSTHTRSFTYLTLRLRHWAAAQSMHTRPKTWATKLQAWGPLPLS